MQSEQAQKLLGEQADAPKDMTQDQPVKLHLGETGKSVFLGVGIPLQRVSVPMPYTSAKSFS